METHASPKVALVGATGQFGHPLALNLAAEGAQVVAVSRGRTGRNAAQLDALEAVGCELAFCPDPTDQESLVQLFEGCDTVALSLRSTYESLMQIDPLYLEAARIAGVRRFVPNEFGAHTLGIPAGTSQFFDAKKAMHKRIEEAGMEKTLIYPGLNVDYCLPNLRFFHQVTTFGDRDLNVATHHVDDIGKVAAKAIIDPRTAGYAVQLYENVLNQHEMLEILRGHWPNHDFPVKHVSTESIEHDMIHGSDEITGKAGVETDRERGQINYICYVSGLVTNIDFPGTLHASELYPDFVYQTPEQLLADRSFVFGE